MSFKHLKLFWNVIKISAQKYTLKIHKQQKSILRITFDSKENFRLCKRNQVFNSLLLIIMPRLVKDFNGMI